MEASWEEAVRTRAYFLWEAGGRPEGRALEHWLEAARAIGSERNRIDPLSSADSVLALLGGLDVEKLPPEERMAVATTQIEVIAEWLSADLAVPPRLDQSSG